MLKYVLFPLVAACSLLSGCALFVVGGAAALGVGTVVYLNGELKSSEQITLDGAWEATQKAMEDLEFAVTEREKDGLSARLVARGSGDKKIQVSLRRVSDSTTDVFIRVNLFGDESYSRLILEQIRKRYPPDR